MWVAMFSNGGVDEKDVIIMTQMRQINDLEKSLKVAEKSAVKAFCPDYFSHFASDLEPRHIGARPKCTTFGLGYHPKPYTHFYTLVVSKPVPYTQFHSPAAIHSPPPHLPQSSLIERQPFFQNRTTHFRLSSPRPTFFKPTSIKCATQLHTQPPPLTHAQDRVFNFVAGLATLPEKVLLRAQSELYNWGGSDMSGVFAPSSRSRRSILSSSSRAAPQPSSPPCRSTSAPLTTSLTSSSRAPPGRKWHTGTVSGLTLSHFCGERERERERESEGKVAEAQARGRRMVREIRTLNKPYGFGC
ncbi:phosphoserine aminotransferase [Vigna unguiculata]|uniref:Phosphoserine aminotransferase n=1 Tax=Vigna unguiculata TaxID=3917 RepID=A0A4D6LFL6_VIGUN|nr:phosphoserine aminotransferase [Vigna unguiculata]